MAPGDFVAVAEQPDQPKAHGIGQCVHDFGEFDLGEITVIRGRCSYHASDATFTIIR